MAQAPTSITATLPSLATKGATPCLTVQAESLALQMFRPLPLATNRVPLQSTSPVLNRPIRTISHSVDLEQMLATRQHPRSTVHSIVDSQALAHRFTVLAQPGLVVEEEAQLAWAPRLNTDQQLPVHSTLRNTTSWVEVAP